ncbi:MAG: response regulator [Chloroflexia bacterium]|nr:response regulator [Chloroflexia bacterium]
MSRRPTEPLRGDILVVDDTPANLRLLSGMLTEQGYKVRSVINGPMALTAARAAPPDLILLDINMPEMDGYQVCRELKGDPRTAAVPIMFISALGETKDKVKAFTIGGVDYITKPFQIEEVLARVETHLNLRNLQRQLQEANEVLEQRVQQRTAELLRLNEAMERFVPREFLSFLQKESIIQVELGDQVQQEMTVLFSDIRGFTARSEQMSPRENFGFLNDYLSRVSPIIRQHGGFIDKYLGDGMMALFPETADDAVQAAIAMQREVGSYNALLEASGQQPIRIGTGLHTGSLMLGIIGEEQRVQGTVIADAVNLAGRLEGLTKLYGVAIIVSEPTLQSLPDRERYRSRSLGRVQVKGKREAISIFEIFQGDREETARLKSESRPIFERGLRLYQEQAFAAAREDFEQVVERNPVDQAAQFYLQRAAYYMDHAVPSNLVCMLPGEQVDWTWPAS